MRTAKMLTAILMLALAAPALSAQSPSAALKAAALIQARSAFPDCQAKDLQIARLLPGWATVCIRAAGKESAAVLRKAASGWSPAAGPLAGISPRDCPDAPAELFQPWPPFSLPQSAFAPARRFSNRDMFLRYPADAVVTVTEGQVRILGPKVKGPVYFGRSYEITVDVFAKAPSVPLDEWGYALLQNDLARMSRSVGTGEARGLFLGAGTYALGSSRVFQIDWSGGDCTLMDLYVLPRSGRHVLRVCTQVYPAGTNPETPHALQSLALAAGTLQTR